ncbi:MAG: DUF4974 domain-containing protein [Pedobacter sp.]|nr:MAG: DUF4974 domain-containing protein [Pedobacter sp.]
MLSHRLRNALPLSGVASTPLHSKTKSRKITLWPRIAVTAAAIIVLVSAGLLFFKFSSTPLKYYFDDIAPGTSGATLTLANGKEIHIKDADTGLIANEPGIRITRAADGKIIYQITETATESNGINTLKTANGQQAEVILADGSLVQLNAASSLKYSFSFKGQQQRIVELSGEGFFQVQKDKQHPFIVKSRAQQIEVLGTQFNVNAYPSDYMIKTTLVEGSIKLSVDELKSETLIPGQQAAINGNTIQIENVEVEYALAWQKGYFMFNDESLEQIMQKLARWYNIQPVFEDPSLKKRVFFGSISKFENISKVLHIMELTNVASFDIVDNQIIISKK